MDNGRFKLMSLIMIATISNGSSSVGIRLYDTNANSYKDVPINSIKTVLSRGASIDNLGLVGSRLVGTNGSIERYPVIFNGRLRGKKSPLIVLNEIGDMGYDVVDWQGKRARYIQDDVVAYSERFGIANGKVVDKGDGKRFISSINGKYDRIELESIKKAAVNNKVDAVDKTSVVKEDKNITSSNNVQSAASTDKNSVAQSNMVGGLSDAMSEAPERLRETSIRDSVATVSSNGNKIDRDSSGYRSPVISVNKPDYDGLKLLDPVSKLTVEQKLARASLVLKHIDPFLYAMYITLNRVPVTDDKILQTMGVSIDTLYYNCGFVRDLPMGQIIFVLEHEMYHIAMRHVSREGARHHTVWNIAGDLFINKTICEEYDIIPGQDIQQMDGDRMGVGIQFADGGLYNKLTDTAKETAESIYDELMSQYNKIQQQMKSKRKQGGQGQGQGQGQGRQGKSGQGKSGQGQGGQGGQGQGNDDGDDKDDIAGVVADMTYHGEKLGKIASVAAIDMVASTDDVNTSPELQDAKASGVLKRALTHSKQIGGHHASFLERLVEVSLVPKVDWKSLLRSYLINATETLSTFSKPDKRFIHSGLIMPGPKPLEPDQISGVKVAIDASGSIGDEALAIALGQILQLIRTYKVSAEIIYWDTAVRVVAPFKSKEEVLAIKPKGGGGTEVECVFEYFDSKKCKVKPIVTLVFTDGYFGDVSHSDVWSKKYKDTIWILSDDACLKDFHKPWGKAASFKTH